MRDDVSGRVVQISNQVNYIFISVCVPVISDICCARIANSEFISHIISSPKLKTLHDLDRALSESAQQLLLVAVVAGCR